MTRMSHLHETVLPNGLRVLCLPYGSAPMAEVRLITPRLSRTPRQSFETLLYAACSVRHQGDPSASRSALEQSAAEMSGMATPWAVLLSGSCLTEDLPALLAFLHRAVNEPAVSRGDVQREFDRLRTQSEIMRSYPQAKSGDALYRELFGDSPAGNRVAGSLYTPSPDEFQGDLPDVPLGPEGATLILVGGFDADDVVERVRETFGAWDTPSKGWEIPAPPAFRPGHLSGVDLPGSPRSQVRLRAECVSREDERYPALFLALNTFGGGGISSRLSRNLRTDNALVYGAVAFVDSIPGAPLLAIEVETAAANTTEVLGSIAEELEGMVSRPPSEEEFRVAQRVGTGAVRTRVTSQADLAGSFTESAMDGGEPLELAAFGEQLAQVTHAEAVEAAREFFSPDRFSGIVAGDAAHVGEPVLRPGTGARRENSRNR